MTAHRLLIRKAEPSDADAARALFAIRSESDEATPTDNARGPDLENPTRKLWLAFDGGRAVAMTSIQERQLRIGKQQRHVAYWTGLFVDPGYRSSLVYPQLLLAMFAGLRGAGIDHLYAAVRRQLVAEAHQKAGFTKIGDLAVLAKPLRPALLWSKYKRLIRQGAAHRVLRAVCGVPDGGIGVLVRLQSMQQAGETINIPWTSSDVEEVAALYRVGAGGCTVQKWTPDTLRARYARDDSRYQLLGVRRGNQLLAAVIIRVVDRALGIRAAVIMDLVHAPDAGRAARAALAAAERLALNHDCDVVLFLDGLPPEDSRLVRRRGYFRSPEKYSLLLRPLRGTAHEPFSVDLRSWRFAFGDHDTF